MEKGTIIDPIQARKKVIRMKHKLTRAVTAVAAAATLAAGTFPAIPTSVAAGTVGTAVSSVGKSDTQAYLRGGAAIVKDSDLGSDVLSLKGGSFGAGWLELPELFKSGCSNGFTFSMKYKLGSDTANYSRLFQFATVPFGTGNSSSYSSPDISVDVKDKKAFRASIFAGTGDSTENDKKHRAIFDLDAAPDSGK